MSVSLALRHVTAADAGKVSSKVLGCGNSFSAMMMNAVGFTPESIKEEPQGTLGFVWTAQKRALNGFKSVHGGALSTLADAFTKIHTKAAFPDRAVCSQNFEISFLSALFENKQCICVTRLVSATGESVFVDFSFQDESSGEIYARGTHVLAIA